MKRNNIDKCRKLRRHQTDAEKKLWALLRNRQLAGVKFRRQFPVTGYILDFYAPQYKLNIEADGGQHYEDKGKQRDEIRTRELHKLGIETVRFSDRDILTNIDGVYETIKRAVEKRQATPSLPLSGIPRSLIYSKRSGTQSSPPCPAQQQKNMDSGMPYSGRGEEVQK
jgi:very-short-patch-repair endonuclease